MGPRLISWLSAWQHMAAFFGHSWSLCVPADFEDGLRNVEVRPPSTSGFVCASTAAGLLCLAGFCTASRNCGDVPSTLPELPDTP